MTVEPNDKHYTRREATDEGVALLYPWGSKTIQKHMKFHGLVFKTPHPQPLSPQGPFLFPFGLLQYHQSYESEIAISHQRGVRNIGGPSTSHVTRVVAASSPCI